MSLARLREFVMGATRIVATSADERETVDAVRPLLAELIRVDDWLPESCAAPVDKMYGQYLLHCDPLERFSLVSFVWAPGQKTPIHDHTVWGLIGMLRGAEISTSYTLSEEGLRACGEPARLAPGEIDHVSPSEGDIHQVSNALADRVSISIHLYGANIGAVRRNTYDASGRRKEFISGYSNAAVPNLWDRSVRTAPVS